MANVLVDVSAATITGPEAGLTLSADVHIWQTNYPLGIADQDTVTVFPLPAQASAYRTSLITAIQARWPTHTVLSVTFPGLDTVLL